jgi:hypothetical protein
MLASDDPRLMVDRDARTVGRRVREALDAGQPVAGFVGDPGVDADAVREFTSAVIRPAASAPRSRAC